LSERTSLSGKAYATALSYGQVDQPLVNPLVDSTTWEVTLGPSFDLADGVSVGASASGLRFRTEDGVTDQRQQSLGANLTYSAGERLELSAAVSLAALETRSRRRGLICPIGTVDVCAFFEIPLVFVDGRIDSRSQQTNYNVAARYLTSESGSLSVAASQGVAPSGFGALVNRQSFAVSFGYAFDERKQLTLGANTLIGRVAGSQAASTQTTGINAAFNWRLYEDLSVGAYCNLSRQTAEGSSQSIDARQFGIALDYSFKLPRQAWSF
jgi:hypothetical protein